MNTYPYMYISAMVDRKPRLALEPEVGIIYNHGLKEQEIKKALDTCRTYKDNFIKEWHKRFD